MKRRKPVSRKKGLSRLPHPKTVSPAPLLDSTFAFAITSVLAAAIELDLCTAINRGADTIQKLAEATSSTQRGLRILLDALAGCGWLTKRGDRYALTPWAAQYLSKESSAYAGGIVFQSKMLRNQWDRLAEVVRTGKSWHAIEGRDDRGEFFSEFVGSLYGMNAAAAEAVAGMLWKSKPPVACEVLDIGAGSGVWSLAVARAVPHARVTVADWPAVVEKATKPFVTRENMGDRYQYLPGNFREVDFGNSKFDVAYLGHICHSEGAENTRTLFQRIYRALQPGGRLIIADMLPDEQRSKATFALLFAVNMLVNTDAGDTFTLAEYRQWLKNAGFRTVETWDVPAPSPIIVATKAESRRARK
jgi:ubiquinone/menaquinone biosynthesis C-methylase UbiE